MAYGPAGDSSSTDVRIGDDPSRYDACWAVGITSGPERRYYGAGYLTDTADRQLGFITATVAGQDRWTYEWTGSGSRRFTAMATSTNGVFVAGVAPEGVRLMKFVP
jgi:hypothetical protein